MGINSHMNFSSRGRTDQVNDLRTSTREVPPSEMPSPIAGRGGEGGGAPMFRLIVTDTAPGSPAATAGPEAGDVLLNVDGAPSAASVLQKAIEANMPPSNCALPGNGKEQELMVQVAPNFDRRVPPSEQPEHGVRARMPRSHGQRWGAVASPRLADRITRSRFVPSVSRGFSAVNGVPPAIFRADLRAIAARLRVTRGIRIYFHLSRRQNENQLSRETLFISRLRNLRISSSILRFNVDDYGALLAIFGAFWNVQLQQQH